MSFTVLAVVIGSLYIISQHYAEASFGPLFGPPGPPMNPFIGPHMHGPPHMPGPHMMPPKMMPVPPGPMIPPKFIRRKMFPPKMRPIPKMFRPPQKFVKPQPPKPMIKKPKRIIIIRRKIMRPFPKQGNPYGYGNHMRPGVPFNPGRVYPVRTVFRRYNGNNGNNNLINYVNNLQNTYIGRGRRQKPIRQGIPAFNTGAFNFISSNSNNYNVNNRNWNEPHLREVIDSGNRIEVRKNSIEPKNFDVSVGKEPIRKSNIKGNARLSGKTIDLSGSNVFSSSKSFVSLSTNLLNKNNANLQSQQLNIIKDRMAKKRERIDLTKVKTPPSFRKERKLGLASGLGGSFIDLTGVSGDVTEQIEPNTNFLSDVSLPSSNMFDAASLSMSPTNDLSGLSASPAGAHVHGKSIDSVGRNDLLVIDNTGPAATDVATVSTANNFLAGGLDLTSTVGDTSGAVLSDIGAHTHVHGTNFGDTGVLASVPETSIVDSSALTNVPGTNIADTGALTNVPGSNIADIGALTNIVDQSTSTGGIPGTNIGDIGAVDVLTLDNTAFSKLEQALQSGQTVDATLLDSIIGGSGGGGASSSGILSGGTVSPVSTGGGIADLGIANAVAPQIYILDGAQAQQLTGSASFAETGGGSHVVGPQVTSASSSASKTSTSSLHQSSASSSHTVANIPHAGKVLPAMPGGHSHTHDIVGVVGEPVGSITVGANTDIMGLFSMPNGHHLPNIPPSVANIPKSIGQRMAHTGGHAIHAGH